MKFFTTISKDFVTLVVGGRKEKEGVRKMMKKVNGDIRILTSRHLRLW